MKRLKHLIFLLWRIGLEKFKSAIGLESPRPTKSEVTVFHKRELKMQIESVFFPPSLIKHRFYPLFLTSTTGRNKVLILSVEKKACYFHQFHIHGMATVRICCLIWTLFSLFSLLDMDTKKTGVPYPQQLHTVLILLEGGLWLESWGLGVPGSCWGHGFPACAWLSSQASVSRVFFLSISALHHVDWHLIPLNNSHMFLHFLHC